MTRNRPSRHRPPGPAAAIAASCALGACGHVEPSPGVDGAPADASGDASAEIPISLRVVTPDGLPETTNVVLVADGDAAWREVTATDGAYRTTIRGPRFAIARACKDGSSAAVEVMYLTVEDATELTDLGCRTAVGGVTVSGNVGGVGADQRYLFGVAPTGWARGAAGRYTVGTVPGVLQLFGALSAATGAERPALRLVAVRDLLVTSTAERDVDFTSDGFDPVTFRVAVGPGEGGPADSVRVELHAGQLPFIVERTALVDDGYRAPPAARLRPGELLTVERAAAPGEDLRHPRSVTAVLAAPADVAVSYPPAYAVDTPAVVATAPAVRLAGTLPRVAGADQYAIMAEVVTAQAAITWRQRYSGRWAGGAAVDYEMPDLRGISGWDVGLPTGEIDWRASVRSSALGDLTMGAPEILTAGDTITEAATTGVFLE